MAKTAGSPQGDEDVLVPRRLLLEVIADGCCPIHLRLQLSRAVASCSDRSELALEEPEEVEEESALPKAGPAASEPQEVGLTRHDLSAVATFLSLAELLELRTSSREVVQLVMQRTGESAAEQLSRVHDRIRTRLWMQRIEVVTAGTKDESVFETRLKSLADEALRTRMESEMQGALVQMEEQVRNFQGVVDRRLQEQEQTMKRMVEERVQQELDTILRSEMMKVQAMVEQKVRERVGAIFRREIQTTVRQLQEKLEELAKENSVLRDAFAEANLRSKCFYWARNPPIFQSATAIASGMPSTALFSMKIRASLAATFPDVPLSLGD